MDANTEKGISLVVFFLITFLLGNLPLFLITKCQVTLRKTGKGQLILEFFNCFAGGVFLGTCLLNILTEGLEEFEEYKKQAGFEGEYPFIQVGTGLGFFLVVLIDKASHAVALHHHGIHLHHSGKVHVNAKQHGHKQDNRQSGKDQEQDKRQDEKEQIMLENKESWTVKNGETDERKNTKENNGLQTVSEAKMSGPKPLSQEIIGQATPKDKRRKYEVSEDTRKQEHSQSHTDQESTSAAAPDCLREELQEHAEYDGHAFPHMDGLRAVLLLVAMSFHTIFDGLAVGLQESATGIWSTSVAIGIHKAIVAVCLGLEMATALEDRPRRVFFSMLFFSFMTPTGVAIGMGVTSGHVDTSAQLLVASILQAMAAGVFFYVTFLEVLGPELLSHHLGVAKVMVATLGFGVISGIKVLDTD